MKGTVMVAALIAGLGAAIAPSVGFAPLSRGDTVAEEAAIRLIDELAAGRFDQATVDWDTAMARRLPADSLATIWGRLLWKVGPVASTGDAEAVPLAGLRAVDVPVRFTRQTLVARVTYDGAGKVVGLVFRPRD